jgi:hypothetical protein
MHTERSNGNLKLLVTLYGEILLIWANEADMMHK